MKEREAQRTVRALDKAIRKIQERLEDDDIRGSVADLVRMVQLRNELTEMLPRQVTVRWIDECQTPTSNER
jgi:hypothetical protein